MTIKELQFVLQRIQDGEEVSIGYHLHPGLKALLDLHDPVGFFEDIEHEPYPANCIKDTKTPRT